jgi:hypothetical protein
MIVIPLEGFCPDTMFGGIIPFPQMKPSDPSGQIPEAEYFPSGLGGLEKSLE